MSESKKNGPKGLTTVEDNKVLVVFPRYVSLELINNKLNIREPDVCGCCEIVKPVTPLEIKRIAEEYRAAIEAMTKNGLDA